MVAALQHVLDAQATANAHEAEGRLHTYTYTPVTLCVSWLCCSGKGLQ